MEVGQRFLVVRFGTNIIANCIEEHQEVIRKNGYCWFGKIGVVPSKKALDDVLSRDNPIVMLYTRNHAYECSLSEVITEKPEEGYPDYYETELFEQGRYPKSYYKLTSIKEIPIGELSKYVVVSSKNELMNTLNKSMSSYFYAEYPNKEAVRNELSQVKPTVSQKKELLPVNDCKYQKEGRCTLKGFVNYQYECERPSTCMRQKR